MHRLTSLPRRDWHHRHLGPAAVSGWAAAAGATIGLSCHHPAAWPALVPATVVYCAAVGAASVDGLKRSAFVLAVGYASWQAAGQWWVALAVSGDGPDAAAWRGVVLLLVVGAQVVWSVLAWVALWPVVVGLKKSGMNAALVHSLAFVLASAAADSLRVIGWAGNGYASLATALVEAPGTAELLPVIGAPGLVFVWTATAAAISGLLLSGLAWTATGAVALVVGAIGSLASASPGRWTVPRTHPLVFVAIQPNVEKRVAWSVEARDSMLDLLARAIESAPREAVVVTSETFVREAPPAAPVGRWAELLDRSARRGVHVLLGIPQTLRVGRTRRLMNTVLHLAPDRQAVYAKERLVAGGEYLPWPQGLGFLYRRVFGAAGVGLLPAPAELTGMLFAADTELGLSICHELSFASTMVKRSRGAAVLVNLADDSWIDSADYRAQMIGMARVRAMEFDKPMLRVSNGGRTVLIDGRGRMAKAAAGRGREILQMSVTPRDGSTPYEQYAELLAAMPFMAVAGVGLAAFAARRRPVA